MRHHGLAFLVLAACAGGLAAEPADSSTEIKVLSGQELTLRPTSAEEVKFTLPVQCPASISFEKLTFPTASVSRNGVPLDPAAVKVERGDAKGSQAIVMTLNLKLLSEQGTYSVKIQPLPDDAKAPRPAVLVFTITRPAAELTATLRLERVIYVPWVWAESEPAEFVLREKSGKSIVNPGAKEWECELRTADGKPAGRLKLKYPDSIPAGGQGVVGVSTTERPALGKSSGVLIVRSPQLTPEEGYTATVDVMTRASHVWLFVIILLGIGAGYFGRARLEAQQLRRLAQIAAHEQIAVLDHQLAVAGPTLKERLAAIRETLSDALHKRRAKPAEIEKAATEAATAAATAVMETETELAGFRQQITTWRTDLRDPAAQPPRIRHVIDEALQGLRDAEGAVKAGDVAKVKEHLDAIDVRPITDAVLEWRDEVAIAFKRFGNWPESLLPAAEENVAAALSSAVGEGSNWKAALPFTEEAYRQLRSSVLKAGIESVLGIARDVRDNLKKQDIKEAEASIAELETAIAAVNAEKTQATSERLGSLAESVRALGTALEKALKAALPKLGPAATAPIKGIDEQMYLDALEDVISRPRSDEELLGPVLESFPTQAEPERPSPAESDRQLPPLAPAPPAWVLAIDVSQPDPERGKPVSFTPRITAPDGQTAPTVTVTWFVNDTKVAQGATASFEYTPQSIGRLVVKAEAVGSDDSRRVAEVAIQVRPTDGQDSLGYLHDALDRTVWYKTLIAIFFIPIIGYMLYADTFVGTLHDFMVAFFWGFTVDVGTAKLLELIPSIKSRPSGLP